MSESILYTAVATDSSSSLTDETTAVLELPAAENTADSRRLYGSASDNNTVQYRMIRKWQVFPGRNRFCCDGRIMMAKDAGVFYLTIFLIITTSGLFFGFDCPYLAGALSPAIPIIDGLLFVFVMCTLLRTSLTDPGVLPRATTDEAAYIERQIDLVANDDTPTYRPPPRTQDITIRGHITKTKYCFTCKIFRPPRASHCSVCDNCVERFDHHCPWVGNCVGQRNYRYFYMFLVSLSLHAIFLFICSIAHLILISRTSDFITAIQQSPASVVVVAVCFFSVWSVIGLAGFHTYLTVSSQTTNEDIKGTYSQRHDSQSQNPFSHGSMCFNFCANVCGPVYPSVIDRRGLTTQSRDEHKLNTAQHDHYGTTTRPTTTATTTNNTSVVLPVAQTTDDLESAVDVQRADICTVSAVNS